MPRVAVPDLPTQPGLEYNAMAGGVVKGTFCHQFRYQELVKSTSYTQRDYYFTNPPYRQEHRYNRPEDNGAKRDYDLYDYPGRYKFDAQGKPFTQYRMEANRVDASTASGTANAIHLMPGHKVELSFHPIAEYNSKYHLLAVSHHGSQPQALEEEAGEGGATTYSASFHAMPARLPYRPPQRHKPFVEGVQQAKIVGPAGEEIYTDEWGRCKVKFHWDRYSKEDEHSSCWIRVASHWAGTQWGHVSIPRIGQEVVISFFDGDPDQPIITGRTYNARNQFPYKLPDNKTKMVIRSDSHKRKGRTGFNEISFEDEDGQEEVYVHAEKDRNEKVNNNHTERIDNNWVQSVGNHKVIEVDRNHDELISGNMNLYVGSKRLGKTISGALKKLTNGIGSIAEKMKVPGIAELDTGNMTITAEKSIVSNAGIFKADNIGLYKNVTVGQNYSINVGSGFSVNANNSANIDSNTTTSINAGYSLNITCGQSGIHLMADGTVYIRGNKLFLEFDDEIDTIATNKIAMKSAKIQLN